MFVLVFIVVVYAYVCVFESLYGYVFMCSHTLFNMFVFLKYVMICDVLCGVFVLVMVVCLYVFVKV